MTVECEDDKCNVEITIQKRESGGYVVKNFVVVHQPEPWSWSSFEKLMTTITKMDTLTHGLIMSWCGKQHIVVRILFET